VPVSDYHQISDVLHVVQQIQPQSLLDIGVGFGKWGMLCREILEIYPGRVSQDEWKLQFDGIEIHPPYRNPLWDMAYNQVYLGDALVVLPTLQKYDLIICCDVIEHFPKDVGKRFVQTILQHARVAIITSPCGYAPQDAIYDNEHERHLSGWGEEDLQDFPHLFKIIGFTFMAVLSADENELEKIHLIDPLAVLGVKKGFRKLVHMAGERLRR
jgi:hypothetical protein